jgi:hypothetical protein
MGPHMYIWILKPLLSTNQKKKMEKKQGRVQEIQYANRMNASCTLAVCILYSASLHKLKGCSNGVPVHTGMHCAPSALLLARTDL